MTIIKHMNVIDSEGRIYCCLRNRVVMYGLDHRTRYCTDCKMNAGERENGVTCLWDDVRDVADPYIVTDPKQEWQSNQKRQVRSSTNGFDGNTGGCLQAIMRSGCTPRRKRNESLGVSTTLRYNE